MSLFFLKVPDFFSSGNYSILNDPLVVIERSNVIISLRDSLPLLITYASHFVQLIP